MGDTTITAETMREHRATWWVYAGRERIRRTKMMRGQWGYDVTCSCGGFDSRTGGAVKPYVEDQLWIHRYESQSSKEDPACTSPKQTR